MSQPKQLETSAFESSPFRLLDLPIEIQMMIYEFHYADSSPKFCGADENTGILEFDGIPNLHLERTCRRISASAKSARNRKMSRHLVMIATGDIETPQIKDFCTLDRYSWIRSHINSLQVFHTHAHSPPDWHLLVRSCTKLRDVGIDLFPRYIETAIDDESSDRELAHHHFSNALEGKFDDMSMHLVEASDLPELINVLSTRTEDPIVVSFVQIVRLFENRKTGLREPCVELNNVIYSIDGDAFLDVRHCRSMYEYGTSGIDMEKPQIEECESTIKDMALTRIALRNLPAWLDDLHTNDEALD